MKNTTTKATQNIQQTAKTEPTTPDRKHDENFFAVEERLMSISQELPKLRFVAQHLSDDYFALSEDDPVERVYILGRHQDFAQAVFLVLDILGRIENSMTELESIGAF